MDRYPTAFRSFRKEEKNCGARGTVHRHKTTEKDVILSPVTVPEGVRDDTLLIN